MALTVLKVVYKRSKKKEVNMALVEELARDHYKWLEKLKEKKSRRKK